ncbi:purine-binding chemotaxis protein CheW [Natronolimnobius sp. AArcel1]|uniref:chemotaxis protein CheW n=1 Tax=Natronolimnobius sp. AArcel1 TaxID=1679093 RepID=UPI0013EB54DF|nr:chemotaxis protein CheW [Natronolimnobius sp. AArcel1]NGM70131.1 purine-binding chemotaxis protein CheW [Natronolimnobius sp. AArcel1]
MTDDRAERIRNIRNRTSDSSDSNEDGDDAETPEETTVGTDGDVDETDSSAETHAPDAATDDDAVDAADDDADTADENAAAGDDEPDETGDVDESEPADSSEANESTTDDAVAAGEGAETDTSGDDADSAGETVTYDERTLEPSTDEQNDGVAAASLQGAIAGMSDTVTIDERVGEATVDATAIGQGANTYGEATADGEQVFDRDNSLVASAHNDEETVQMLEFFLNENRYAIEIDRISAIVEMKEITRFPRGPDAIDGVTDLRGEITGVLDPTAMLDVERNEPSDDHYIVVLERDDDTQKLGIRVTDVSQAVTYRESQIDDTGSVMDGGTGQHEYVDGIIKKEVNGETALVAWLAVDDLIENTSMDHGLGEIGHEQRV